MAAIQPDVKPLQLTISPAQRDLIQKQANEAQLTSTLAARQSGQASTRQVAPNLVDDWSQNLTRYLSLLSGSIQPSPPPPPPPPPLPQQLGQWQTAMLHLTTTLRLGARRL